MLFEMACQYANDVLDGKEVANQVCKKTMSAILDDLRTAT